MRRFALILALVAAISVNPAHAQDAERSPQPMKSIPAESPSPASQADDKPTEAADSTDDGVDESAKKPLVVKATEVSGTVEWSPVGTGPLELDAWKPFDAGHTFEPNAQIRTGLRSSCVLAFGDMTVFQVRSATLISIDQAYASATTETSRIGLGYGTIRGASSEGELRSDVVIESTQATLVKRGTEGMEFFVEAGTGRFEIRLATEGLVEAIRKGLQPGRATRLIRPGEYATSRDIVALWLTQAKFDRQVRFYDTSAVTTADAAFDVQNPTGLGVVAPGGGSQLTSLAAPGRSGSGGFESSMPVTNQPSIMILQPTPVLRPEGNFGTAPIFRVLLPR